jgi:hypothetical protein
MTRPALFGLLNKANPSGGHSGLHPLRLMAYHCIDIAGIRNMQRRGNHVLQQRFSANFMQNLWAARLEPGSLSRRHNYHSQF